MINYIRSSLQKTTQNPLYKITLVPLTIFSVALIAAYMDVTGLNPTAIVLFILVAFLPFYMAFYSIVRYFRVLENFIIETTKAIKIKLFLPTKVMSAFYKPLAAKKSLVLADKDIRNLELILGLEKQFGGISEKGGSIRIDGQFEGDIETANLIIGEDAVVNANIKAKSVIIEGKVIGDIDCEGKVELLSSGSLEGTLRTYDLAMAEGAFFQGPIRMKRWEKSFTSDPKRQSGRY